MSTEKISAAVGTEQDIANLVWTPSTGDAAYTLFLGAGASATSGIPTGQELVRIWKKELERKYAEQGITEKIPDDYSKLFETLFKCSECRRMLIEKLVVQGRPSFGYLYLAGLINHGIFHRTLTTNFDDLIAESLLRFYDVTPLVCSFDSAVRNMRLNSPRPKILKLHGDFLYDNLRNLASDMIKLDSNMELKMREACKDSGLIVIGYAGADESIMSPIKEMLRSDEHLTLGLHWCFLKDSSKTTETGKRLKSEIPPELLKFQQNYPDKVFFYEISGFDSLMKCVFDRKRSKSALGSELRSDHERHEILPPALLDPHGSSLYRRFRDGLDATTFVYLHDKAGDMTKDLTVFEKRASDTNSPEILIDGADTSHSLNSKAKRDENRLEEALGYLEDSKTSLIQAEELVEKRTEAWAKKANARARFRILRRWTGIWSDRAAVLCKLSRIDEAKIAVEKTLEYVALGITYAINHPEVASGQEAANFQYNGAYALAVRNILSTTLVEEDFKLALKYYQEIKTVSGFVKDLQGEFGGGILVPILEEEIERLESQQVAVIS